MDAAGCTVWHQGNCRKERRMKRTLFASLVIVLLIIGPSCQLFDSSPTSPEPDVDIQNETGINMDSPTGGFTYSDEEPAFGEPELFTPLMNETAVEDTIEENLRVREMIRHRHVRMFRFRAIWGHLANSFDDMSVADYCPLDWSGVLHLNGGAIVIERIIAFEPGDSISRVDMSTIQWVSHTGPHVDGIQVRLIVSPGPNDDPTNAIEPTLTIRTGPFSRSFTLDELMALQMMEPVDRCGNGISINSHIIPPFCPHGYLMGGWRTIEPDTIVVDSTETRGVVLGRYRGVWISHHGGPGGYLKGVFGINSGGERVFFGKYVDTLGRFQGILKGTYGPSPYVSADVAHPHGWFQGVWFGRDRLVKGRLKGHWVSCEPGHGYFHGLWGMNCSDNL